MKAWLLLSLALICSPISGADLETEWKASKAAVLAKYPDAGKAESALSIAAAKIEQEWLAANDQRLDSHDAPMLVYDEAQARLQAEASIESGSEKTWTLSQKEEHDRAWKVAVAEAVQFFPALADPNSRLSRRTEELRKEYQSSSNNTHRLAYEANGATYIATQAQSSIPPLTSAEMQREALLKDAIALPKHSEPIREALPPMPNKTEAELNRVKAEIADLRQKMSALEAKLEESERKRLDAEFSAKLKDDTIQRWKGIAEGALSKAEQWKGTAQQANAVSQANRQSAEEWREAARQSQQAPVSYSPYRSSRQTPVSVIQTAPGHYQTSDGRTVIETAPGVFVTH